MKTFQTAGACAPDKNYMVDLSSRLKAIKAMVDQGLYFTINRARQYGKTTTLSALRSYLADIYDVISLDFQRITDADFKTEGDFTYAFCDELKRRTRGKMTIPVEIMDRLNTILSRDAATLKMRNLFDVIEDWCAVAEKKLVLIIDEVDSATNNQVFLDFLARLRDAYLSRNLEGYPAFQSVILAGVTDVKNMKRKLRPDDDHKENSPWNIAADFNVDMSFSSTDIAGMLGEYEADHHTGMDVNTVAQIIEDYTSGYPFLVSRICQLLDGDTKIDWNRHGIAEIVRRILMETNTLFDSLMGKVHSNEGLREVLWRILFSGETLTFNAYTLAIADAKMFGFVRNNNGTVEVSNRIFETLLYNYFLSQEELNSLTYQAATEDKQQYIKNGRLDMDYVLKRFVTIYDDLYGDKNETFDEAEGRQRFLLFIRPIINGTGNYYIEAETRNKKRMDLVIDYKGEQFVVELKIWDGTKYHEEGEKQLCGYLDRMHLEKGYLLTYSFNKQKKTGVEYRTINGKKLMEAVV